jgi:hypothetical protein
LDSFDIDTTEGNFINEMNQKKNSLSEVNQATFSIPEKSDISLATKGISTTSHHLTNHNNGYLGTNSALTTMNTLNLSLLKRLSLFCIATLSWSCSGEPAPAQEPVEAISISEELDVQANVFVVAAEADTMLFGESGTAIFIESNSFETINGEPVPGPINVSLKEYYDLSDILVQNLSTEAKAKMLETGGMINLEVNWNGEPVKLKQGKEVIIHFPKNESNKEMQLFSEYSGDQSENDNIVKWEEEPNSGGYEIDSITLWIIKYDDLDSQYMMLEDGTDIWAWLRTEVTLTPKERDYVRLRDVSITFDVAKTGEVQNVALQKKYSKSKCKRLLKIIEQMPQLRPFKRSGQAAEMESGVTFGVKFIPPKYADNASYLQTIENKYPDFEDKSINDLDQVELNYYIFSTAKLGWLNCDKFVNDPSPKVDMTLSLADPEDLMIKFIYKDFKSVITPTFKDGINRFNGIPEGKDVTLMVIRSGTKKVQISITEHITSTGEISGIEFKEYTMGELKKELEKLN